MPELQEIQTSRANRLHQVLARLELSFDQHRSLSIFAILALGFLVRVWHASGTFLNSDEVMHFAAANQPTWLLSYRVSLAISHPPLLIFVMHAWRVLGTSELMLRMPSILAGMAFCWFTFRWAQMLFEKSVAWTMFVFVLFLPSSIELSTEIRQYALFLAFAMGSAYFLERALAKNSAGTMLLSGAVPLARNRFAFFRVFICAGARVLRHLENVQPPPRTESHSRLDRRATRGSRVVRSSLFHPDPPTQPVLRRTRRDPRLDGQCLPQPLLLHSRKSEPACV